MAILALLYFTIIHLENNSSMWDIEIILSIVNWEDEQYSLHAHTNTKFYVDKIDDDAGTADLKNKYFKHLCVKYVMELDKEFMYMNTVWYNMNIFVLVFLGFVSTCIGFRQGLARKWHMAFTNKANEETG